MLKYQLFFFENLIRQDITPQISSKLNPGKAFFVDTLSELEIEKEQTLNSLVNNLFNLQQEESITLYIQLHQHNLVVLLDHITGDLGEEDIENISRITPATTWSNLYKYIFLTLREILTFIEDKFSKYLDTDCKVPDYNIHAVQSIFEDCIQHIEERGKQAGCDEKLLSVIVNFGNFYLKKSTRALITYHSLSYAKELLKRVSELLSFSVLENIDEKLNDLLSYLNFNALDYFYYRTKVIKKELEHLPTLREKLDQLSLIQKCANQTPSKPGFIYSKLHPGLQDLFKTWITEEIKYLKEKERSTADNSLVAQELNRWQNFKVTTTFSVPQLGNFLRLLVESEIFINANKSELLDFFSYFFASVKQENISPGSLRTNFYKDDAALSKAVRDILLTLINNSRKG